MKIERGIEVRGLRITLSLQSLDTETHSAMSGNHVVFNSIADALGAHGADLVSVFVDERRVQEAVEE
jgi:hypothetical protein